MKIETSKISVFYSEADRYGNKVNGHRMRASRLAVELAHLLSIPKANIEYNRGHVPLANIDTSVLIVDTWLRQGFFGRISNRTITVSITDEADNGYFLNPDFVIDPSPGADLQMREMDASTIYLLGPMYSILNPKIGLYPNTNENVAVFIPGGNSNLFYNELKKCGVGMLDFHNAGYEVATLSDMSQEDYARWLSRASVVVSSAGVSAIEAAALGKQLFIVKTASDQERNFRGLLLCGAALRLSQKEVKIFLDGNRSVHVNYFDIDGARVAAKKIAQKVTERCL